jgi:fibronectin type 3 domain-containing protein
VSTIQRADIQVQIEGDDSANIRVVAHDVFPPAIPTGLQAVYSGEGQKPFIDLIWAPVTNTDLAGYNIYRATSGNNAIKLNSAPVKSPSYRDTFVVSGITYTYTVSSIDVRANESPRSEPASETVP